MALAALEVLPEQPFPCLSYQRSSLINAMLQATYPIRA
jgi:hypothetical protein